MPSVRLAGTTHFTHNFLTPISVMAINHLSVIMNGDFREGRFKKGIMLIGTRYGGYGWTVMSGRIFLNWLGDFTSPPAPLLVKERGARVALA